MQLQEVRIGEAGRKALKSVGCRVEHYVDQNDKCAVAQSGTNAWRVMFPRPCQVRSREAHRYTASGRKRNVRGPRRYPGGTATWKHEGREVCVSWVDYRTLNPGGVVLINDLKVDGESIAGAYMPTKSCYE